MRAANKDEINYLTQMLNPAFSFASQKASDVYQLLDFLENTDIHQELRAAVKLKISRTKNPVRNVPDDVIQTRKSQVQAKAEAFAETLRSNC